MAKYIKLFMVFALLLTCTACEYPKARITKAKWDGFKAEEREILVNVDMEVDNPNFFDIPINGISYSFDFFNVPLVDGKSHIEKKLEAQKTTSFTLPLAMSVEKGIDIGSKLLKNKVWPWHIKGSVFLDTPIGSVSAPYEKMGTWQRPVMLDNVGSTIGKGLEILGDFLKK